MFTIKTILHPTDFSEPSRLAFDVASSLARDYQAELIVLHVLPPPLSLGSGGPMTPVQGEDEVRAQLEQVRPADPRVNVRHKLTINHPLSRTEADAILEAATEDRADLIVMGTHGRGVISRMLMGSVAENVLRNASCPVLTVKSLPPDAAT